MGVSIKKPLMNSVAGVLERAGCPILNFAFFAKFRVGMLALFEKWVSRNPVNRGLESSAELWRWSSFRAYALGETGPLGVNQ